MTEFSTKLVKVTDTYAPMIERSLSSNGVNMDPYSKMCVVNAISAINTVLDSKGISWNDAQLDTNNLTQTLLHIAALKLNAAASPREVYFQLRNVKAGTVKGDDGKEHDVWRKQIEMGIEGDGNDAILRNFGAGVDKVGQVWLVREGDEFSYPEHVGFEVTPPRWSPRGKGKVIRVVYPVRMTDGSEQYHFAERDDVLKNLVAHVKNNLMNETFGIAAKRYDATPKQKQEIDAKKAEIINRVVELGLEDALDDKDLQKYISPAWTDPNSRESMIVRKMRNNVTKPIPKDFSNGFVGMLYNEASDADVAATQREISDRANSQTIDIDYENVPQEPQNDPDPSAESAPEDPVTKEPAPVAEQQAAAAPFL